MESLRHSNTQPDKTNSLEQGLYDGLDHAVVDGNSTDTLNLPKKSEDTDVLSSPPYNYSNEPDAPASNEDPITPQPSQETHPTHPPETPPTLPPPSS